MVAEFGRVLAVAAALVLASGAAIGASDAVSAVPTNAATSCHPVDNPVGSSGDSMVYSIEVRDPTGCPTVLYDFVGPISAAFFAGTGFRRGVNAYEWNTVETTELVRGQQRLVVVDPTPAWLSAYRGFDSCTTVDSPAGLQTRCTAAALSQLPNNGLELAIGGVGTGGVLVFLIYMWRRACRVDSDCNVRPALPKQPEMR